YTYHENTRQIIGQRSRKTYGLGDRVRVLVDRIDPVEKKIQFALLGDAENHGRFGETRSRVTLKGKTSQASRARKEDHPL
ncbi:MAG: hypothetical protein WBQ00_04720, partial [Terriglobales bacterium]